MELITYLFKLFSPISYLIYSNLTEKQWKL